MSNNNENTEIIFMKKGTSIEEFQGESENKNDNNCILIIGDIKINTNFEFYNNRDHIFFSKKETL